MNKIAIQTTKELISFLEKSPTAFQAIVSTEAFLQSDGYRKLSESDTWKLERGGKYYVTRNMSALLAFRIPEGACDSFMIAASHSDSPTFRLKFDYESITFGKYIRLDTERYGGFILNTWFDRPLSVAGRVVYRDGNRVLAKPVTVDRDLCLIPSVAIHFNRNVNDGVKINPACDTFPLLSASDKKGALRQIVAEYAGIRPEDILSEDLFLYNRTPGTIWGAGQEFFSAPRLDNLMCAFGTLRGFLAARSNGAIPVYAVLDNEETGNRTKQGSAGSFLRDTLERICENLGSDLRQVLASSMLLSADNGHAQHPNHPELSDPINAPHMNEGVVIKSNASQLYTTDAVSAALFREICRRADVPTQLFANRSDLAGGGTLGRDASVLTPMVSVDIGLAQLAMHSSYETAGCADTEHLINGSKAFFETHIYSPSDGCYRIG